MKFSLQIHQVEVPVPGGTLTDARTPRRRSSASSSATSRSTAKGSAFTGAGRPDRRLPRARPAARCARRRCREHRAGAARRRRARRDVYWREDGGFRADRHLHGDGARRRAATIDGPGDRRDRATRRSSCRPAPRRSTARQRRHRRRRDAGSAAAATATPVLRRDGERHGHRDRRDHLGRQRLPYIPPAELTIDPSPDAAHRGRRRRSTRSRTRCCATRCGTSTSSTATRSCSISGLADLRLRPRLQPGDPRRERRLRLLRAVPPVPRRGGRQRRSSGRSRTAPSNPGIRDGDMFLTQRPVDRRDAPVRRGVIARPVFVRRASCSAGSPTRCTSGTSAAPRPAASTRWPRTSSGSRRASRR